MPFFYDVFILNGIAFFVSVFLTMVLFLTVMRKRKKSIFNVLVTNFIAFIISSMICNFILFQLQTYIAMPYIEEAISQQCDAVAGDGAFHTDSRFEWRSDNDEISCRLSEGEWQCRC